MFANIPTATRALILINVGVFVLQQYSATRCRHLFALWPHDSAAFHPWQLLSYAFLHGSIGHIFLNMFALFMFGRALEAYWGGAALRHLLPGVRARRSADAARRGGQRRPAAPVLGASGGVFGVLLAFAWYFPKQRLILIPIPIPLPAWLFVTLYALAELIFGITGTEQGVAHFAHLGGHARRRAVHPLLAGAAALQFVGAGEIRTGPRCVPQASHRSAWPKRLRPKMRPSGSVTQLPPPSTCASTRRTCSAQPGLAQKGAPRSTSRCPVKVSSAALARARRGSGKGITCISAPFGRSLRGTSVRGSLDQGVTRPWRMHDAPAGSAPRYHLRYRG